MSPVSTPVVIPDIINQLVGITLEHLLYEVRHRRPEVVAHSQGSYEAIFQPTDPGDLSPEERFMAGLRVAILTPSPLLVAHHRRQLTEKSVNAATLAAVESLPLGDDLPARTKAILHHVDRLTLEPVTATPEHVAALEAAGLSVRAIIALSQLIAFTSYQARVLVVLQLLNGFEPESNPQPKVPQTDGKGVTGWTADSLEWHAWLRTLQLEDATSAQIAVLEESTPTAKSSPYYLLLAQEVENSSGALEAL